MKEIDIISGSYIEIFKTRYLHIDPLPKSGSDRKYFRITSPDRTIIGACNPVIEENEAFIGFTSNFISKGLPVPRVLAYLPEKNVYFIQDLGDTSLFNWLQSRHCASEFTDEIKNIFRKIIDNLILFQTIGIVGLNLELCYPHKSFDRQSMMWDMNYFKYMFLKLVAVPYNERRLEDDFLRLADFLLETSQEYFLYRDFQSANIMMVDDSPWFIDYQGGRKGAPHYDIASLLNDAKVQISQPDREELLDYYTKYFCSATKTDAVQFMTYYNGFCLIRLMQALGAFGFRGLYEKRPTFTESIVPGVKLLQYYADNAESNIKLPELYNTIRTIQESPVFRQLQKV